MYKKLYLLLFISFCVRGVLIDAPPQVLFSWENRTTLPNEKGEAFTWTKDAAREYWNGISQAGELKFSHVRNMVLASCEKLPARLSEPKVLRDQVNSSFLVWSPDGKLASASRYERYVNIWDKALKRVDQVFNGRQNVAAVAWSTDGDRIAVAGHDVVDDPTVSIYEVKSGTHRVLPWAPLNPRVLAWTSKNKLIGIGEGPEAAGGIAEILDTLTGDVEQSFKMEGGTMEPRVLAVNAQDARLAYGEQRYFQPCVGVWDAQTGERKDSMRIATPLQLAFVGWGSQVGGKNILEVGLQDGQIYNVDLITKEVKSKVKLPIVICISMAKSADGRIAAGFEDKTIKVWTDYGEVLRKYFAKDMIEHMREKNENGQPKLTADQAYAQMLMVALFFNLKQRGKALKITDVVETINERAGYELTSGQELAKIRDSFPDLPRSALKIFNISK